MQVPTESPHQNQYELARINAFDTLLIYSAQSQEESLVYALGFQHSARKAACDSISMKSPSMRSKATKVNDQYALPHRDVELSPVGAMAGESRNKR